jgi:hypothetical protein
LNFDRLLQLSDDSEHSSDDEQSENDDDDGGDISTKAEEREPGDTEQTTEDGVKKVLHNSRDRDESPNTRKVGVLLSLVRS